MNEYTYNEIEVGQTVSFTKQITAEMEDAFREVSGDINPLHKDDSFARKIGNGKFKNHVAFGMLTASLLSTLAGVYLPGKYSLIHSIDNISFKNPVFIGDRLTITGTVNAKQDALGLIMLGAKIINQNDKLVLKANMKILVQK